MKGVVAVLECAQNVQTDRCCCFTAILHMLSTNAAVSRHPRQIAVVLMITQRQIAVVLMITQRQMAVVLMITQRQMAVVWFTPLTDGCSLVYSLDR